MLENDAYKKILINHYCIFIFFPKRQPFYPSKNFTIFCLLNRAEALLVILLSFIELILLTSSPFTYYG